MLIAFPFLSPAAAQLPIIFLLSFASGPINAIVCLLFRGRALLIFLSKTDDLEAIFRADSKNSGR